MGPLDKFPGFDKIELKEKNTVNAAKDKTEKQDGISLATSCLGFMYFWFVSIHTG